MQARFALGKGLEQFGQLFGGGEDKVRFAGNEACGSKRARPRVMALIRNYQVHPKLF